MSAPCPVNRIIRRFIDFQFENKHADGRYRDDIRLSIGLPILRRAADGLRLQQNIQTPLVGEFMDIALLGSIRQGGVQRLQSIEELIPFSIQQSSPKLRNPVGNLDWQ